MTEPPAAPVAQVDPGGAGAVPGGVGGGDLPAIFRAADLSPVVLLVSLLTAAALGAGHALTPGHGKTLMAAYLVGTRGTPLHAAGLGLSVTLSHTLGILVLAALIVGAEGVLSPDTVVRGAPIVAAISILAIGGWMLFGEARRRWRAGAADRAHQAAHAHGAAHDHAADAAGAHDHDQGDEAHHDNAADDPVGTHSHGGVAHSHLPPSGTTITWRGLFVLGLAGGLIPSTSAPPDPARLDRCRPAGLRVRPGRRLRARHGAGDGWDRPRPRPRPRADRSVRRRLTARPCERVRAAGRGVPGAGAGPVPHRSRRSAAGRRSDRLRAVARPVAA